jgi:uncharacterized CHY-type Zn-finger protein
VNASEPLTIHGRDVNERTQCAHYHSERDIIAIQHKCCGEFYANHPAQVWPKAEFHTEAIYCGNCYQTLSITRYLSCHSTCPHCQAAFNPGCANHYHLYFEQ